MWGFLLGCLVVAVIIVGLFVLSVRQFERDMEGY
jgi:hypothetical protein